MLKKVLGDRIFCGLDLGTSRFKAGVIRAKGAQDCELLGVFEAPTRGFKNSSVTDLKELTECIGSALSGLSRKTGVNIKDVQLGIGRELIESRLSSAVIPLLDRGSKVIAPLDVKKVNHQAILLGVKLEEEILHNFPQSYRVDNANLALNPVGLYGRKLEVNLLLILAQVNRMNNLLKALNQAGFEMENCFFTSIACAESSLNKKMKTDGCVLVDIGSQMTDVLIFKDGFLKYLESIRSGGDQVTRSLSRELNVTFDLAEDIKKSYACALTSEVNGDEEILIKKESNYAPVKKAVLCRSIENDVEHMVQAIHRAITHSNLYDQLGAGITMVGGGALLAGLSERVESMTHLPVAMGKVNIANTRINNSALTSSACIGLAQLGMNRYYSSSLASSGQLHWTNRMTNKIKEVYQEYF